MGSENDCAGRESENESIHLPRGQPTQVQVLVDGTDSNTASLVASYAGKVIAAYSNDAAAEQQGVRVIARSRGAVPNTSYTEVTARSRVWFNPDLYSRNYFVPGVITARARSCGAYGVSASPSTAPWFRSLFPARWPVPSASTSRS